MSETRELDERDIAPRVRRPLIFSTFDGLKSGGSFVLVNDHDPKALCYQVEAERRDRFRWEYLATGPRGRQVRIART
jgi:uncharacterized protein (DUF2249 family)